MQRKTLDLIFSIGGGLLAILLLVLGLVLQNQANFAKDYVHDQLSAQKIVFTPAKYLAPEENAACLKKNAGKPLTTGKQAECYANNYIALHLKEVNDGKTYAETSGATRELEAQLTEAQKSDPDSAATKALEEKVAAGSEKVATLFRGETLRGLLLTSYGFSVFGERAQQAALVAFLVAAVLAIATIAGFIHAFSKAGEEVIS